MARLWTSCPWGGCLVPAAIGEVGGGGVRERDGEKYDSLPLGGATSPAGRSKTDAGVAHVSHIN